MYGTRVRVTHNNIRYCIFVPYFDTITVNTSFATTIYHMYHDA
jgi:hypothetical protein